MITISNRLAHRVGFAWFVALSAALITLAITAKRMNTQHQQDAPDAQIAQLQARIEMLEAFKSEQVNAPAAVAENEFQQLRERWQRRWDSLSTFVRNANLESVKTRLDALEQKVDTHKPTALPPRQRAENTRSASAIPTFRPLGIELRGGQRFLAIRPTGANNLEQIRLLQIGDTEGRWQLKTLGPGSAGFRVGDHIRQLEWAEE